ncbi:FAD-binding and (Fe-S)-binding domain-containing protein [Pelagibacterium lacus]|uniref:FAD-binding oxidoreductase n=1 Tax=Pelagibacterium lacus TaxID=2282655 RepID=A0A369W7V0_9HYPH|nr:FAD-binding and (Fe-S)-binding domain-containing protein [Pelagibacterium lacus]RDE08131.1 FAD-binding oxidoreductase [Pelagibacterium lacus]
MTLHVSIPGPASASLFHKACAAIIESGFAGDVTFDFSARAAVSTDNSVYEIMPDLVVAPRDSDDVQLLMAVLARPEFATLPVTARGGGTGTNGQSLNRGVVVNFQRFMTRILEVNSAEGWADVEPGIVLDEFNAAIAATGLQFAPNTSTSSRCTIGGMVGTDASGKGSRLYGKTSDNILGLEVVLDRGRKLSSLSGDRSDAPELYAELAAACDEGREALIANTPRISRRFTGYDLERARPDTDRLDWWRLFLGAEGTLGLVTRIRVRLVPLPRHERLVVVAFDSFRQALAAGSAILEHDPLAIEIMDEWVHRLAREAGLMARLPAHVQGTGGQPIAHMFVEFVGAEPDTLDAQVEGFLARAATLPGVVGTHVAVDAAERQDLWGIRSAAVGLLGKREGTRRPIAFVEDCVVPVEHLVPFVNGFDRIMKQHGLNYGIYGHIDVGCLHVRPSLDLDDPLDRDTFRAISDAVYALCNAHGGIFWGEHGKGIRGAYLPDFVGPVAYRALQRVKAAFDPAERFNPGKLVVVDRARLGISDPAFRKGNAPGDAFEKSYHCNGNSACLSHSRFTSMCPSYQATRDNRLSPKGRSDALRNWREAQAGQADDLDAIEASVLATLNDCLGCNACASSCPVQVSIPSMKSAFLDHYYQRHRRPLRDHAVAAIEPMARTVDALRPLAWLGMALGRAIAARATGMVDLPRIAPRSLRALGHPVRRWDRLAATELTANTVLLLEDAFTTTFDTDAVAAVAGGLAALGYRPVIVTLPPGGKGAHVKGMTRRFRARAARQIAALKAVAALKTPMLGIDPAFVLLTRQEYRRLDSGVPALLLVQEFLHGEMTRGADWPKARPAAPLKLMLHCTEASALPASGQLWRDVFAALGIDLQPMKTGCCGMSGTFGHEREHQEMSRNLFDATWRPLVEGETSVLATGFSCRCQIERLSPASALHPMAAIVANFPPTGAQGT